MKSENNLAELYRLLLNIIRTGVVTEVNADEWLCRVQTGELETTWLNWLTLRAGRSRTWWKPSVGEQVLLLSIGGDLTTAFVLPGIYSDDIPPPSTSEDAMVMTFPDGGWLEYEPEKGRWLVKAMSSLRIEAPDNIDLATNLLTISAAKTRIQGAVEQTGGPMSSNGIVVDAHAHSGVIGGPDTTGGPV
ncbi:phage baseplate assembly protein V [Phytobacter sp. V91]|uniref:phage baseplate assembly protein V n=1 Tax=Phytobacter sp. V91 TaxID=3369425 RepID=UPI003F6174AB